MQLRARAGQGATQLCRGTTYRPTRAAARVDHLSDLRRGASGALGGAPPSSSVRRQIGPQLGQGAIELHSGATAGALVGQGATEYLVLLAVVLIVALVSVALLGFFPGMASDAQITQSQMYWKSASPISIVESAARASTNSGNTFPYLLVRNAGMYPIRITGMIGNDGGKAPYVEADGSCGLPNPYANFSDYYYLAPGEEKYIGVGGSWYGLACNRYIASYVGGTSSNNNVRGAASVCQNSTTSPGTLDYKTLGFEYIQYVEGQQITKRQIGKEWIVKCGPPF